MKKTLLDRKTLLHNMEDIYERLLTEGEVRWADDILTTKRQLRARLRPVVERITMQDYENLLIEKIKLKEELEETKKQLDSYKTITAEEFAVKLKGHPFMVRPSGHSYRKI